MSKALDPFRFILIALAGWMNHRQYQVIDYLREENRVLQRSCVARRLANNDGQVPGYQRISIQSVANDGDRGYIETDRIRTSQYYAVA
jgi:hypothetical protein